MGNYYDNVKFNNITIPRYVKVKSSIESLMKIIDLEKVESDGKDRVLVAILQLIDENDDKTVEEKIEDVRDFIYNGHVFSHYFSDENKEKAIEILSKTSLLTDDERFIYAINFYMPGDIAFKDVYNKCGKQVSNIVKEYNLTQKEAERLVIGRVMEISNFYEKYQEEIERQQRMNETEVLAVVQEATEDPTEENVRKAETLVSGLVNSSLKESLQNELQTLKAIQVLKVDKPEETELPKSDTEDMFQEELFPTNEEDSITNETVEEIEETVLEEPKPLEQQKEEINEEQSKEIENEFVEEKTSNEGQTVPEIGKEVMTSLQSLVAGSRENARKVEQLNGELENKNTEIEKLNNVVIDQEVELNKKDSIIEENARKVEQLNGELENKNTEVEKLNNVVVDQEVELNKKDSIIEEKTKKISDLETEMETKNQAFNEEIAAKDNEIASLNSKIASLTATLESYKGSLSDIQSFLVSAQKEEFTKKM